MGKGAHNNRSSKRHRTLRKLKHGKGKGNKKKSTKKRRFNPNHGSTGYLKASNYDKKNHTIKKEYYGPSNLKYGGTEIGEMDIEVWKVVKVKEVRTEVKTPVRKLNWGYDDEE